MTSPRMPSPRGSVMLLVAVLLVVITVLALAAIGFSGSERVAASNFRSSEELVACADAGRQYLLSRFRLFGQAPAYLAPMDQRLDRAALTSCDGGTPDDPDGRCVRSGHIGDMSVSGVRVLPVRAGQRGNARDLSNVLVTSGAGFGSTYQVVVHCVDGRGAQSEVEFTLRFGL